MDYVAFIVASAGKGNRPPRRYDVTTRQQAGQTVDRLQGEGVALKDIDVFGVVAVDKAEVRS